MTGTAIALFTFMMASVASADQLQGDADASIAAAPHGNSLSATQSPGTTVAYDFSAWIVDTPPNSGPNDNDVFEVAGSCTTAPCPVNVTISRAGDWLDASPGTPASFQFTAYNAEQDGTIRVTVPSGTACGTTKTMTVTLAATATNGRVLNPATVNLSYVISTPACAGGNTAPSVAFSSPPSSADEGSPVSFTFAITDPDADSWSFAAGYPSCGTGTVSNAAIDQAARTGSFECTFPDGPATETVAVKVSDGTAQSNEASTQVSVDNVAPTVDSPAFAASSVDCRTTVTLSGISFSDPGVNDADWTVEIDWGDGSTPTTFTTSSQGDQPDQHHAYVAPGTYTATVTVTDKDDGQGSSASSNQVVVNQTYSVGFLPPVDGSSAAAQVVNKMKNGRVVPVKATVFDDCALSYVTAPATVTVKVTKIPGSGSGTSDPIEEYADAGQSNGNTNLFRWTSDASVPGGGFWIYNLDSRALGLVVGNLYRVDIYVGSVKATVDEWAVLQPVK